MLRIRRMRFLQLRRSGVYPGVDVVYYGVGQSLEYDFELAQALILRRSVCALMARRRNVWMRMVRWS